MMMSAAVRVEDDSDEAIQWIARLRSHDVSNQDRAAFIEWMADPNHRRAFDELLAMWERLPEYLDSMPVG
jgi:ferric-dicitrate binding protein FerR (iron transport regulator)